MKKYMALASLLLFTPLTALADGWGMTHHTNNIYSATSQAQAPSKILPTIDYWHRRVHFQFDAMETIASLGREDKFRSGFNMYYSLRRGKMLDGVRGSFQFGVSVDIDQYKGAALTSDDEEASGGTDVYTNIWALAQPRLGMEIFRKKSRFGFGIYVVSGIGIARVPNVERASNEDPLQATELAVGTGLQISSWMLIK